MQFVSNITPIERKKPISSGFGATSYFHNKRHPKDMGVPELDAFLTHLTTVDNVAASNQNQAFNALLFLYRHVLEIQLDDRIPRAPTSFTAANKNLA